MPAVEREHPARSRELRRPHDIELQHIGLAGARVQPLNEELVTLGRVVRRVLNPDVNTRISKLETRDLAREHLALRAECTARKRDHSAGVLGLAASAPDDGGE